MTESRSQMFALESMVLGRFLHPAVTIAAGICSVDAHHSGTWLCGLRAAFRFGAANAKLARSAGVRRSISSTIDSSYNDLLYVVAYGRRTADGRGAATLEPAGRGVKVLGSDGMTDPAKIQFE